MQLDFGVPKLDVMYRRIEQSIKLYSGFAEKVDSWLFLWNKPNLSNHKIYSLGFI